MTQYKVILTRVLKGEKKHSRWLSEGRYEFGGNSEIPEDGIIVQVDCPGIPPLYISNTDITKVRRSKPGTPITSLGWDIPKANAGE
jgi:hypothetical protein